MLVQGLLAGTVVLLGGLAAVGWRHRAEPGAAVFALLEGVSAAWVGLTLVGLFVPEGTLRLRMWGTTTGLGFVVAALWVAFILRYTGHERWLCPRRIGAVVAPLLAGALLYGVAPVWPPLTDRAVQSTTVAGTVVTESVGPLGLALFVYVYLTLLAGLLVVLWAALDGDGLFVGQALALTLGTVVPVAASAAEVVGLAGGYPLVQATMSVQALLWGYAVFRQEFLRVVPAVARVGERAVVKELDDGVLIIDGGTVASANPAARGHLSAEPVGEPVETLLEVMDVPDLEALPTQFRRRGRTYQAKLSTVSDWRDETVGRALVLREVTDLARRQQRLEVLNRIMRHNMRNDMTVVQGCADEICDRADEETADLSATIARRAESLLAISEKAVEIDRLLAEGGERRVVDLESFVGDRVGQVASRFPEATVELSLESASVCTVPRLLAPVLEEVVENALEHAGPGADVAVTASREDDGARVEVADDGPGIPDLEVATLESGRETPLEHATSLGLWFIHWGTRSLGGRVDIETTNGGSTVAVTVPNLSTVETPPPNGEPSDVPAAPAAADD